MHDQTTTESSGRPIRAAGRRPVAVLSAAVLVMARAAYREDRADLAGRAGLGIHVLEGAEDGTRPAWELPYAEFMALADAVALAHPSWRDLFETAAACDLLVTLPARRRSGDGDRCAGRRRYTGHNRDAAAVGDHRGVPRRARRGVRADDGGPARGMRQPDLPGVRRLPVRDRRAGLRAFSPATR